MMEKMDGAEVKRAAAGQKKAQLEQRFLEAWRRLFPSFPKPTMQHRFHPIRKWRFDFAFLEERLAIEIDGASFTAGAHNRGAQQSKDYEKMNHATKLGWRVLRFNTKDLGNPEYCAEFTAEVLTNAVEVIPTRRAAV